MYSKSQKLTSDSIQCNAGFKNEEFIGIHDEMLQLEVLKRQGARSLGEAFGPRRRPAKFGHTASENGTWGAV